MNYTCKKWITLVKNDVLQHSSAFFTSKNPETIQLWLGPNEENVDSQKCDSLIGQFFSNLLKVQYLQFGTFKASSRVVLVKADSQMEGLGF